MISCEGMVVVVLKVIGDVNYDVSCFTLQETWVCHVLCEVSAAVWTPLLQKRFHNGSNSSMDMAEKKDSLLWATWQPGDSIFLPSWGYISRI